MMRFIKSYVRNFELKDRTLLNKCLLHLYKYGNLLLESEEGSGFLVFKVTKKYSQFTQKSRVDQSVQRVKMDSFNQEVKLKKDVLGCKLVLNLKNTNSLQPLNFFHIKYH